MDLCVPTIQCFDVSAVQWEVNGCGFILVCSFPEQPRHHEESLSFVQVCANISFTIYKVFIFSMSNRHLMMRVDMLRKWRLFWNQATYSSIHRWANYKRNYALSLFFEACIFISFTGMVVALAHDREFRRKFHWCGLSLAVGGRSALPEHCTLPSAASVSLHMVRATQHITHDHITFDLSSCQLFCQEHVLHQDGQSAERCSCSQRLQHPSSWRAIQLWEERISVGLCAKNVPRQGLWSEGLRCFQLSEL